jgi:hypothetical protein
VGYRSEAQAFARRIVAGEKYFESLKSRAESGTLAPAVETLLLHYAYGKPVEHVSLSTGHEAELGSMTVEQLASRAADLHQLLMSRHAEDLHRAEEARKMREAEAAARDVQKRQAEQEAQSVFSAVDRKVH